MRLNNLNDPSRPQCVKVLQFPVNIHIICRLKRFFVKRAWVAAFHKAEGISEFNEELSASQGPCSIELISAVYWRSHVVLLSVLSSQSHTRPPSFFCVKSKTWLKSLTLVNFQLDAQNSYLFIYNTFIKILYMFRALPCLSSGGLRLNCIYMQPLVSSLSAGDCPLHRLRKCSFLTGAQTSWRWAG